MSTASHVKNPLTVIAIFAGLAELGGTAVLPLLEAETQAIYVWFLMTFPSLLVLLFFVTLWFAHTVLYAPSDYKDEINFIKASGARLIQKFHREAVEASLETPNIQGDQGPSLPDGDEEDLPPEADVAGGDVNVTSQPPGDEPLSDLRRSDGLLDDAKLTHAFSKRLKNMVDITATVRRAEELAINAISATTGFAFSRNVSPESNQDLVFDAVYQDKDQTTVVEVKYNRIGGIPPSGYQDSLHAAFIYYAALPKAKQKGFSLILAIVFAPGISDVNKELFRPAMERRLRAYPFPVELQTYDLDTLEAFVP